MKNRIDCASKCSRTLVYEVLAVARWLALLLLVAIGSSAVWLQYSRQQEISWVFFLVCVTGGIILFWIGRCLLNSECLNMQQQGRCRRIVVRPIKVQ